jgi:3-phenylpropionate/trans-cinnamate dioxygenase ferredoxin subunit
MKRYDVEGHAVLLARVDGEYYATTSICPHLRGDLSRGKLEGTVVTCPRHHSRFDIRDGHVVRWTDFSGLARTLNDTVRSPRPLQTYPVLVENGRVMIKL